MEKRSIKLEDIENRRTEKLLYFEMFKIIDSKKYEASIKSFGQENVYVMFEHVSESIDSNSQLLSEELQEFSGKGIITK